MQNTVQELFHHLMTMTMHEGLFIHSRTKPSGTIDKMPFVAYDNYYIRSPQCHCMCFVCVYALQCKFHIIITTNIITLIQC